MCSPACPDRGLIDDFSLVQKLVYRASFWGLFVIGTYGLALESPLWAAVYAVGFTTADMVLFMTTICRHCPYPYHRGTCLFYPPTLLTRFVRYGGPRMSRAEGVGMALGLGLPVLVPNIWLWDKGWLLVAFWITALPTMVGVPLLLCHRCRHHGCPLNRVPRRLREDAGA